MTGVLAPIRPVGMSDEMASDWQVAIVAKTAHLSDAMFREGCRQASAKCSHHGEVLKAILASNAEIEELKRKMAAIDDPCLAAERKAARQVSNDNSVQGLIQRAARDCEA